MIFPPFTKLTTERLFLRKLKLDDAEQVFKIRSDARVSEFVDREPTLSVDKSLQFIKTILRNQKNKQGLMWAITLKDDPKLIGTLVYWHIVSERDEAEIGYEMLPEYFGKGIMQEALKKVIEFGFGTMQLKTILAFTKPQNLRSVNLLRKCGFIETAEAENGYMIFKLSNK
jgi:[ribosomal protein S5]-alanine N-acetyltransferase